MSNAGKSMLRGAKQALAFAEGKKGHGCKVHIPDEINVRRIRKKTGLSQQNFANQYGFPLRTLQEWEQGRTIPTGASRAFLLVIDREPKAVKRALVAALV